MMTEPTCPCAACNPKAWWMIVCPICGSKRCARAADHANACEAKFANVTLIIPRTKTADEIIANLTAKGLGWDIGHTGTLIECRIWKWPDVIGRYRPTKLEPLADMLTKALATIKEETDAR